MVFDELRASSPGVAVAGPSVWTGKGSTRRATFGTIALPSFLVSNDCRFALGRQGGVPGLPGGFGESFAVDVLEKAAE
ncbi:hypothetical protein [Rhizobium laguerreae]|uniref:Uncharacterized protein n=1 Tax=Rhizobium laguerreae TaxID=1076926 RepID=A0AAX2QU22_9HYPH|nr:hypothetical protein [Rhizobium laguerreae]TCU30289.1 hypothetical protein EV131_101783 [Rhizobium laguerreae]